MSPHFILDMVYNTCYGSAHLRTGEVPVISMKWFSAMGCAVLGFATVFILIPLLLRWSAHSAFRRGRDPHHTHTAQVPRIGGLALVAAFLAVEWGIMVFFPGERQRIPNRPVVIWSSLAMFALGFWDDLRPLGAKSKLGFQVLVALLVHLAGFGVEALKLPFGGQIIELHFWGAGLTVLWLVGITNLLNLIDGVDGLAAGIALMLMALLVYVGAQNGTFVLLTAGMTGALLAFLSFNFPPARIYLGDGGAYFLGFQIALFALISSHKGSVLAALIAPLFVLGLPIVDTSLAIARRGLRGLPVFRPDRRHLHHHLLNMGLSRRQVVLSFYSVTLIFLAMGFVAFWSRGQLVPILLGLALVLLLLCAGRLSFCREWFAVGRTLGHSLAIRREVEYGLSLMAWLRCESRRCGSVEQLYLDLAFAAQRMGFSYVRLRLFDGERSWEQFPGSATPYAFRQQVQLGDSGELEVRASNENYTPGPHLYFASKHGSRIADQRLFEILVDLLAEGWHAAVRTGFGPGPLRFDVLMPVQTGERVPLWTPNRQKSPQQERGIEVLSSH